MKLHNLLPAIGEGNDGSTVTLAMLHGLIAAIADLTMFSCTSWSWWSVGFAIDRLRVRVSAEHYGVKTLGKFLTPMVRP